MSSHADEIDFDLFEGIDDKTLAGANFTADVIGELRRVFASLHDASGVTQKDIADRLGVGKSAVHRWLYGDGNMTLKKLGELIWAMDCRGTFNITADLHERCEATEPSKEVAEYGEASPNIPTNMTSGFWFKLLSVPQVEARHMQIATGNGRFLNMTGTINNEMIQACILTSAQHELLANFRYLPVPQAIDGAVSKEGKSDPLGPASVREYGQEINEAPGRASSIRLLSIESVA